ncbi:helix-turn-helix domain-containing protein [Burkholderia sp. 3C]
MASASENLLTWETELSRALMPMRFERTHRPGFGTLEYQGRFLHLSNLRLGQISTCGMISTSREAAAKGFLKFLFVTAGNSRILQGGRSISVTANTWTAYDPSMPYRLDSESGFECFAAIMPASVAAVPAALLDDLTAYVSETQGSAHLALDLIKLALVGQTGDLREQERAAAATAIMTLLEAAMHRRCEEGGLPRGIQKEAHLRLLIDRYILTHYADPSFSVDDLARMAAISRRTLYNLFKATGNTPYQALQKQRLDASVVMLGDPEQCQLSVTEIALNAGFPDASHFSRLFRSHMGVAPSEYRNAKRHAR